jgi:hypothetical protein
MFSTTRKSGLFVAAIAITLAAAPAKRVTLSWTAPSQYTQSLSLTSAAMNSVVLEGLASGTWYSAVKAVNAAGVESSLSAEVSKVL